MKIHVDASNTNIVDTKHCPAPQEYMGNEMNVGHQKLQRRQKR